MSVILLTPSIVSTLKCPETKSRIEYCDSETPGLLLEVRSSGAATWYLRYKTDGATKYISFGPLSEVTLAQARKLAKDMKAQIRVQGRDPRSEIKAKREMLTFDELWSKHYAVFAEPRKRSFSRDEQLYRIRIKGAFGKMRLNQITRQQVQSFHTELLAEGLAPASCDHHLKLMKYMFNLANDWGLFDGTNPISRVPLFNADNRVQHLLSEEELERLMRVLSTDDNRPVCLIIQWLLSTGMRLGAALAARWDQVDRKHCLLTIPASIAKSKRNSSIPINSSALEILDQLGTEGKYDYLFVNRKTGNPFTTITKVWDRLRKKAGLPHFRLHDGRHTFASLLVNNGVSLYTVQTLLNHSSPVVSQRYAHLSAKTLQDASNAASLSIKGAMQSRRATPAAQVVSLQGDLVDVVPVALQADVMRLAA